MKILKIMLISGLLIAGSRPFTCRAQVQELQQLLLDMEKLTQMKSILADMKSGYQIYAQGYGSISSLAKGNFNLHNTFLTGLLKVSPAIRNDARIPEIVAMQASLLSEYRTAAQQFRSSGSFSAAELDYIARVYTQLVSQTLADTEELALILTAGTLRMSDAERLETLDRLHANCNDRLQFLRYFNRDGVLLSLQRSRDQADTQTLRQLYGLNF